MVVARILALVAIAAAGAMVVASLPDLVRYIRMRNM